jgi:ABC-2 type transport system ATP-binding protein
MNTAAHNGCAVEVQDLVKTFGNFVAVDHVSFQVKKGEIFGFLGPNGAGKSTVIRVLCGLLSPTSGGGSVAGLDVVQQPEEIRKHIGYMSQKFSLYDDLRVEENIDFFSRIYGVPKERRAERKEYVLRMAGLEDRRATTTRLLAGGWKQRLALGCAIVHEPRILFLDEPTSGVDPIARRGFWDLIYQLAEAGHSILVTTHYMDEADKLCDRIAIVDHGKLMALDSPMRLKASIPGRNVLEVSFATPPAGWPAVLAALPHVESVTGHDDLYRIASDNGPATTTALVAMAARAGVGIVSLSVQSTSLDDVFVHYTGHALRDALQEASPMDRPFMVQR